MSNNRNLPRGGPLAPLGQTTGPRIVKPTTSGTLANSVDELICMDIPRPPFHCVETEEGWVRFEGREDVLPATPAEKKPCVRLYDRSLGDEWFSRFTPHRFPPEKGVYTWLLYTEKDSDALQFVCKKTQSLYEIGTRHKAIARDPTLGVHTVYGAGELERYEYGSILFNLASGAYMLNFLKGARGVKAKRDKIVEMVQIFLPGASDTEDDPTSLLSGTEYRFRPYAFDPIPSAILDIYRERLRVVPCDPPNASSSAFASSSAGAFSSPPRGGSSSAAAAPSTPVGGGGGYQGFKGFSAAASPAGGSSAAAAPITPVGGGGGLFRRFGDSSAASSAGGGLGLFGSPVGSSAGGGLFGSPAGSSAGGGLFGSGEGSSRTRRNRRRRNKRRQTRRRRNQA